MEVSIILLIISIVLGVYFVRFWLLVRKLKGPKTWPIVGSIPQMLLNIGRIHEWTTDQLLASPTLGTYQTCGIFIFPFLQNWRRSFSTVTCHPKTLEHILRTNFHNYPRGPTWQSTFGDVIGVQGISYVNGKEWILQRKIVVLELSKSKLSLSLYRWVNPTIKNDLLPILDKASKYNIPVDLQNLMLRFCTDNIYGLALGKKLNTLLNPEDPLALAMDITFKSAFKRFFLPNILWKFMRFFSIGSEGSLKKSIQILTNTITEVQEERNNGNKDETFDDLCWTFMKKVQVINGHILPSSAITSTILDILLAGRDSVATSTSWFLWLVMNNPRVEKKIVDEIVMVLRKTRCKDRDDSKVTNFTEPPCGEETQEWMEEPLSYEEINGLVYLHATLLETLRLYPAVPKIVRYAICDDILPDGTYVPAGSDIILSLYSVGRMKCVWGEDCLEFKPERWLSADETRIERPEDGYKYAAFNGGTRTCIGKYLTFLEMKSAASAILLRYKLSPVPAHQVSPKLSFTLSMKNGLKVNLKRRDLSDFDVLKY